MNVVEYFVKYHMSNYTQENLEFILYVFTIEDVRRWGNPDRWRGLLLANGWSLTWEQGSWYAMGGSTSRDDDYNLEKHPQGDYAARVKVYDQLLADYNRNDR